MINPDLQAEDFTDEEYKYIGTLNDIDVCYLVREYQKLKVSEATLARVRDALYPGVPSHAFEVVKQVRLALMPVLELSPEALQNMQQLIDNPPEPSERLKAAAERQGER